MIHVIFVCLGNICRSPMAEAIFKDLVTKKGLGHAFHIDSVGTAGYHIGDLAHRGTRRILERYGIKCDIRSRQINQQDLEKADYLIAMDQHNMSDLKYQAGGRLLDARLYLLLSFAETRVKDVPDPYYSGNFEEVYNLVNAGCQGLLAHIREKHKI